MIAKKVNALMPQNLNKLGTERSNHAIKQALDLQNLRWDKSTLPVLFVNTGGITLTTFEFLRNKTGLSFFGENNIILFNPKRKDFVNYINLS